jgi:hypothetical protein
MIRLYNGPDLCQIIRTALPMKGLGDRIFDYFDAEAAASLILNKRADGWPTLSPGVGEAWDKDLNF